jgi:hypothetical protein
MATKLRSDDYQKRSTCRQLRRVAKGDDKEFRGDGIGCAGYDDSDCAVPQSAQRGAKGS